MPDLSTVSFDIDNLLASYRSHRFTPSDVVDEVYARIKREGDLGVWTHLCPKAEIVQQVKQIISIPDAQSLPLFGIPFCVKDNIHVRVYQQQPVVLPFRILLMKQLRLSKNYWMPVQY